MLEYEIRVQSKTERKDNNNILSPQDHIERLEEINIKWKGKDYAFEQRCRDLELFKCEFGRCDVPQKYSVDPSLGTC